MKNKHWKRALAFALALTLVTGVSPVNVGSGGIADRAEIVSKAANPTATIEPEGAGSVTVSDGVYTATPNEYYTFDHWEYNYGITVTDDLNPKDFSHYALQWVKAVFVTTPATITPAPTAKKLLNDGSAHTLLDTTNREVLHGTVYYALGSSNSVAPSDGWSENVPTATDAGTYYVWYKVTATDEHYADFNPVCIPVTIYTPLNGSGIAEDPYQINTLDELNRFLDNSGTNNLFNGADENGMTHLLLKDNITVGHLIALNTDIILDLNGNELTVNGSNSDQMVFQTGNYLLTVLDSSTEKNGILSVNGADDSWYGGNAFSGKLTLKSGTVNLNGANGESDYEGGYYSDGGTAFSGTLTVNDGKLNLKAGIGANNGVLISDSSTVSLTGGTFNFDPTSYLNGGYRAVQSGDYFNVSLPPYFISLNGEASEFFTSNAERASDKELITLTIKKGYTLTSLPVVNDGAVSVTDNHDGTYSFIMPEENVAITLSKNSVEKVPFTITNGENIAAIKVNNEQVTSADIDDVVEIVVDYPKNSDGSPDTSKILKKLTVTGASGEIEFNKTGYDTYEMTMPAEAVTISAEFAQLYEYTVFYFSNNEEDKATAGRILCENLSHDGILEQNVILNSKAVYSMLANMPDAENLQFKYKDSDGWSASKTVTVTTNPNTTSLEEQATRLPNGDKVLIIKGETNMSGVSFISETNEKVNNVSINKTEDFFTLADSNISAPAEPIREGYTFLGWEDRITDTIYQAGENVPAPAANDVLTLNAKWKHNDIKVTFKDGNTTLSDSTVEYEQKVKEPAKPTKNGYAFVKWVVAENSGSLRKGESFDFNTPITESLTLKAEWKHVHNYGYYALNAHVFDGAFDKYCNSQNDKYLLPSLHVKVCGSWDDYKIEAHHFDETGKCADCGYQKEVKYVTVVNLSENSLEGKQYVKGSSITVTAPEKKDNKVFDFWCYAVDDNTNYSMFSKSRSVTFTVPENDPMQKVTVYPVYKVQQQPVENINQANIQWHVSKVKNNTELQFVMCYDLPKGWVARDFCLRYGNNDDIRYFRKSSLSGMDVMGQNFKSMVGKKNNGYYMFDTPKTADLMFGSVPIYYPVNDNVITKEFNNNAWKLWDKMYSGKGITVSDMSLGAFGRSIAGRTSGTPYVTLKPTSSNQIFYMMGYLNCVNTTTKEVKMIKVAPVAFSLDGNPNGYQETTTAISSN